MAIIPFQGGTSALWQRSVDTSQNFEPISQVIQAEKNVIRHLSFTIEEMSQVN